MAIVAGRGDNIVGKKGDSEKEVMVILKGRWIINSNNALMQQYAYASRLKLTVLNLVSPPLDIPLCLSSPVTLTRL